MPVINLTGVVQSGGPWDTVIAPKNPRVTLRCTKGGSLTVRLTVYEQTGIPVDMTSATAVLTVKKNPLDYEVALSVTAMLIGDPLAGQAEFTIATTALLYVEPGRYTYSVWLSHGGTRDAVVPASPFIIEPTVLPVA